MLAAALAAAGWYFFGRTQGIGAPEDPTKVLVVRTGRMIGYAAVLEQVGFDAAEGDLAYWADKARTEIEGLDVDGIEAVMTLADQYGYGYVLFEAPQDVDFGPLSIDEIPEVPEHVRFAAVSVGDFADPHEMTVNPEPSAAIKSTKITLLQALFAQERLAALRPEDEAELGVAEIQLRDKLEAAMHELDKLPAAEKLAERVLADVQRLLVEEERGEPIPTLIGETLEDGEAIPLPNGQILALARSLRVVTPDAVQVELEPTEEERLLHGPAGEGPADRTVCTGLAGGMFPATEAVKINFAPDGSAALVKSLTDGSNLWVYTPGTPCGFENKGAVAPPGPGIDGAPVPHASGRVAQAGMVDGAGVIRIVAAGQSEETMLGRVDGVSFGAVVWLDADHLAALGDGPSVFLFDRNVPTQVLELDGHAFDAADRLGELALLGGSTRELLVTAGNAPRRLYRLTMPPDVFEAPPRLVPTVDETEAPPRPVATVGETEAPPPAEENEESPVVAVDPTKFTITALTHEGNVANPTSSPDGAWVAFAIYEPSLDRPDAADDDEIAVMSLAGGQLKVLTRNALTDGRPRFTSDGRHVVFLTRSQVPRTRWQITTPRIVPLPAG
jgi:hypothetical protein